MRVALLQGPAETPDPEAGLAAVADAAARAAAAGARLLVTPEMSLTGYAIGADRVAELAEPVPGPLTDRVAAIAAEHGLAIAVGLPVRTPAGVANTVVVVGSDGSLLAGYAKAHLYGDVDRDAFVPGDVGVVQFRLDGLVVGLLVCYDVEFPEAVRAHALAGTELLVVPTGLMDPYGHVGTVLVPARAYESQVFLAYANRTGAEGEFVYCGASCVIVPDGTELARAGRGEELLVADVDPAVLTASRRVNTHLADRRPELYPTETPA
ncbi:carbon-nitrogen hydrolase family protein [Geodermatophilus poikilotrophus]|uniref:Predicted amidohydrolase n=1 Tax=Geodermatophilus poikilotrophus TaxID=1333667 RepID=A0A1I0BWF2_9ACTN|nr:carbon-nitrogen hydrolase family protein [Geodermatophilus poikilotrophus]SET11169.1 Predicted amidohydrolase [Geodermatophilus poikilotrophus]